MPDPSALTSYRLYRLLCCCRWLCLYRTQPTSLACVAGQAMASIQPLAALSALCLSLAGPWSVRANSLHPCGSFRIANTTFCFLDANGDGKYQDRDEEFCPDGWVTRGGIRCRKKGVGAAPAAPSNLLSVRVLTSWEEACAGSMSTDAINRYLREGYRIVGTRIQTDRKSTRLNSSH